MQCLLKEEKKGNNFEVYDEKKNMHFYFDLIKLLLNNFNI